MSQKLFEMNEVQYKELINEITRKDPVMKFGDYVSGSSAQERANKAWEKLGKEMGFRPNTVQPVYGKTDRFFTAEII
jgi:calcineurin-like phosphoesterase family protein